MFTVKEIYSNVYKCVPGQVICLQHPTPSNDADSSRSIDDVAQLLRRI